MNRIGESLSLIHFHSVIAHSWSSTVAVDDKISDILPTIINVLTSLKDYIPGGMHTITNIRGITSQIGLLTYLDSINNLIIGKTFEKNVGKPIKLTASLLKFTSQTSNYLLALVPLVTANPYIMTAVNVAKVANKVFLSISLGLTITSILSEGKDSLRWNHYVQIAALASITYLVAAPLLITNPPLMVIAGMIANVTMGTLFLKQMSDLVGGIKTERIVTYLKTVDLKQIAQTGGEFALYTAAPVVSSVVAIREFSHHAENLDKAEKKIYELGQRVLGNKDTVDYQATMQAIATEMKNEYSDLLKKGFQIFWLPGMMAYSVIAFISSLISEETNPNIFVLNTLKKTESSIDEEVHNLKAMVRDDIAKYCKDHHITRAQFTEMVNTLKGISSFDFDRAKAIDKIDEILGNMRSGFGESMIDSLIAYIQLENQSNIAQLAVHYNEIKKEFPGHEGAIQASIETIQSLNQRRAGLQKIKEEYIDPEQELLDKSNELKSRIAEGEAGVVNIQERIIKHQESSVKLSETFYQARLASFAKNNKMDKRTLTALERHLRPFFEELIENGKKPILNKKQLKTLIDLMLFENFEIEFVEPLRQTKNLSTLYFDYLKLIDETRIEHIDNDSKLNQYVSLNLPSYLEFEDSQEKVDVLAKEVRDLRQLNIDLKDLSSTLQSEKEELAQLTSKVEKANILKSEIKDEIKTLENLAVGQQKMGESNESRIEQSSKRIESLEKELKNIFRGHGPT